MLLTFPEDFVSLQRNRQPNERMAISNNQHNCAMSTGSKIVQPNSSRVNHFNTKHGHAVGNKRSGEYTSWSAMWERCRRKKHHAFNRYGGRGIKVCKEWRSFSNFLKDMGARPKGFTLERIDCNGHYEPSNCKWATRETQANNMRSNHVLEFQGCRKTISQWARDVGMLKTTIRQRLLRGWSVKDALCVALKQ